jgi:hypothetical protein
MFGSTYLVRLSTENVASFGSRRLTLLFQPQFQQAIDLQAVSVSSSMTENSSQVDPFFCFHSVWWGETLP